MPTDIELPEYGRVYVGRSEKGVCCATFHDWSKLRIWILDESHGQIDWLLKHHIDIKHSVLRVLSCDQRAEGPWILYDANSGEDYSEDVNNDEDENNNALMKPGYDWDSDKDDILDNEYEDGQCFDVTFLGFHPYKDVVFLNLSQSKVLAYHLNTSMVQVLGNVCPAYYDDISGLCAHIVSSFPYTPCLMEFPENKSEAHVED
ncbi:hypothetical protein ACP70R_033583 [Stipagrostis hirtigluma subsp. patula]